MNQGQLTVTELTQAFHPSSNRTLKEFQLFSTTYKKMFDTTYNVQQKKNCLMLRSQSSPTIQQLIDEHKVVLDVLLADLAKVGRHDVTHFVEKLKHHGGVDVLLGDCCQPDVGALHVEEAGAGDVSHRGPDLLPGVDHVHAERVHGIPPGTETDI